MNIDIIHAQLTTTKEQGYIGIIAFQVEGHKQHYEIILQSKDFKNWGYSLHFLAESGDENQLIFLDDRIDEDDTLFQKFVQAITVLHQS